jgi:hypothetical protein
MTNAEIRLWYVEQVQGIAKSVEGLRGKSVALIEVAREAWRLRRAARLEARSKMGQAIEVEFVRARDLKLYGDPDGPSFEQIIERAREKGFSGDGVYEEVIRSALRTDPVTNSQVLGRETSTKQ